MSATRPSRKPTVAPATGPASSPIDSATSGSRSALASNTTICATTASCSTTTATTSTVRRTTVPKVTFTARPARSGPRREPRVRTSTMSSSTHVREGPQVHALVQLALVGVDPRDAPDRDPPREQRLEPRGAPPGGDHRRSPRDCAALLHEVQDQVVRVTHGGLHEAVGAVRHELRRHPAGVVGDQRHARGVRCDVRHAPDQARAADDRLVDAQALVRALVDRDRGVPDRRRAPDHARGHVIVPVGEAGRLVEADQPPQLLCVAFGGLGRGELRAQLLVLLLEVLVLGLRVDDVARPAHEVAGRLQRAAGALLERRHHLQEPTLDSVQAARRGLAEIDGQ